jgi:hypothetical protein
MNFRAIYEHIASGRKTPLLFADAADGHYEVAICEAVLKSAAAERWAPVRK